MDENLDTKIRRAINCMEAQKRNSNINIYDGIVIDGRHYEFQGTSFFEDKIKLHVPTAFFDMPYDQARIKYPSSDRPQIIKTDDTGKVNITLSLIPNNNIYDNQISQTKDNIKSILKRINPSYLFFDEGVECIEGKSVGYFEFKSPAIDTTLFNLMFMAAINKNLLMGTFNCIYEEHLKWKHIAYQIMTSLKMGL
jgi:hypothetical protein